MTTKELIRQKIDAYYAEYKAKFHQNGDSYHLGIIDGLDMAEQILGTLPDEPVTDCHELEKEIKEQIYERFYDLNGIAVIGTSGYAEVKDMEDIARHFAEWQYQKDRGEFAKIKAKTWCEGFDACKEQMMEGAVEGEVCILPGHVAYVKEKNNESLKQYLLDNFKAGDEVRIIILPNDEDNDRTIV